MLSKEEILTLIGKIKAGIGEENVNKIEDDLIKLSTGVSSLYGKNKELESDLAQVNTEAQNRRLAFNDLKSKYDTEKSDFESQITKLQESNNNEELTSEINRLKEFEKSTIESQRTDFKMFVDGIKDHNKFDIVKTRFKLPTNDDGIDFENFDKIEYDDLKHNLDKMKELQELQYFDSNSNNQQTPPPGSPAARGTAGSFEDRLTQAKSPQDLRKLVEEAKGSSRNN